MTTAIKTVNIPNIAWDMAADIHFPPRFDEAKQYPVVVTAHPIGSCKEQTSGSVYGRALAKVGFVAVAFDASFQGASGGEPRFVENPEFRVSDFRFVVDYLQGLPYVDPERIGVLGICGGGGYAINASMTDYRFKCCVAITPTNFGRLSREGFAHYEPAEALRNMARQRTLEALGADRDVIDYLPATLEEAEYTTVDVDLLEATEYYKTSRGMAPNGSAKALFSFNSAALGWDAFHFANKLMTRPLLIIVGDIIGGFGAYLDSHEIYNRAISEEKHLIILPGVSHYMLYDRPVAVGPALKHIMPFFHKHLGKAM